MPWSLQIARHSLRGDSGFARSVRQITTAARLVAMPQAMTKASCIALFLPCFQVLQQPMISLLVVYFPARLHPVLPSHHG